MQTTANSTNDKKLEADIKIDEMKRSGEIARYAQHRALIEQLKWQSQDFN